MTKAHEAHPVAVVAVVRRGDRDRNDRRHRRARPLPGYAFELRSVTSCRSPATSPPGANLDRAVKQAVSRTPP
jgi:hypothetical protein